MPDVSGKNVLIVGDSLSASAAAPGQVMANALVGATAVKVDAKVGRSAISFYRSEDGAAHIADASDFGPDVAIVVLGTNDIVAGAASDQQYMQQLHDDLAQLGADVWAIGPPSFAAGHRLEPGQPAIVSMMVDIFGDHFIDMRPLSADLTGTKDRTADGIHFTAASAKVLGQRMATQVLGAGGFSLGWGLLAAGVAAYLLLR